MDVRLKLLKEVTMGLLSGYVKFKAFRKGIDFIKRTFLKNHSTQRVAR